jgi:hypothetical protein
MQLPQMFSREKKIGGAQLMREGEGLPFGIDKKYSTLCIGRHIGRLSPTSNITIFGPRRGLEDCWRCSYRYRLEADDMISKNQL